MVSSERAREAGREAERGLEVRDLVVRYEPARRGEAAVVAVDGVSLDVRPGEIVALLGPSGCGKSSLLRAVAGLEPVAAGEVRWAGRTIDRLPVHRRGFGLMFQDGQLFPHRDVARNVAYGIEGRLPRADREARVAELLDAVGLHGYGTRPVATLSGGERQRVALARALAPRPVLLLLDEPLSALDRALRERLAVDLRAVLTATGTTALFVTHDHDEAFTVADRVGVMGAGRLLQVGAPDELWHHPVTTQVADFLGYEAVLQGTGDTVVAVAPGAFGIVDEAAPGDALDRRTAVVQGASFRKGHTEVTLDVAGVGLVTTFVPWDRVPVPGSVVHVALDPGQTARTRLARS